MTPARGHRRWWTVAGLGIGIALVQGCAAQQSVAGPAKGGATEAPQAAPPPAGTDRTDREENDGEGPKAALGRAKGDFDRAERELLTAAGDCGTACRALASMERATAHLCQLASSDEDRSRCVEAKTKVLSARERVRSTCGECPGGPSLDRNAPIPSQRQ